MAGGRVHDPPTKRELERRVTRLEDDVTLPETPPPSFLAWGEQQGVEDPDVIAGAWVHAVTETPFGDPEMTAYQLRLENELFPEGVDPDPGPGGPP